MMLARSTLEIHRCSMHWKQTLYKHKNRSAPAELSNKCKCPLGVAESARRGWLGGQPHCYMKAFMGLDVEIFIACHFYFNLLKCKAQSDARHTDLAFRQFDQRGFLPDWFMHSHILLIYATSYAYSAGEPIHDKLICNHLKGVCGACVHVARCVQGHMLARFASVT